MSIVLTFDEFCDKDIACDYCRCEKPYYYISNGYEDCGGEYCDESYENYLDEMMISKRAMDISERVKVTIYG